MVVLPPLFWKNLAPAGKGGGKNPSGAIAKVLDEEYGSFERFKKIFSQTAISVVSYVLVMQRGYRCEQKRAGSSGSSAAYPRTL